MTVATVPLIIERIQTATLESPIAVFKVPHLSGKLNAVFANTIHVQRMIEIRHPDFVGIFHNKMSEGAISKQLYDAASRSHNYG